MKMMRRVVDPESSPKRSARESTRQSSEPDNAQVTVTSNAIPVVSRRREVVANALLFLFALLFVLLTVRFTYRAPAVTERWVECVRTEVRNGAANSSTGDGRTWCLLK